MFAFLCVFFSKIVDHLRKCATILGREKVSFDFNREKSRKCFVFDKITGKYNCFCLFFFFFFFIIIIFFHSVCFCFKLERKKLLLKVHTSILSLSSLKFSSVFSSLFFCWDFVLNKGHFHILSIFVIATNFENQTANVAGNLFL